MHLYRNYTIKPNFYKHRASGKVDFKVSCVPMLPAGKTEGIPDINF